MGACIGKKSSKYAIRKRLLSTHDINQDETKKPKSSPQLSEKLQATDDLIDNNDGELPILPLDDNNSIDSEVQVIIDEQKIINEALSKPLPSRIVSATDSELEYELAKLIYGSPEGDYGEKTLNTNTNNSNGDV